MKVENIVNGILDENCYIIYNSSNECLIVDPGSEEKRIEKYIIDNNLKVIGILITHYHFDHIGALEYLKNVFKVDNIIDYKSSNNVKLSSFEFKIIKNFGHTLDSCSFCFDNENIMFTGDFIFKDTIGNYEKENEEYMINSLKEFKKIEKNYKIYPGHYESTDVFYEKENNPYLRGL